MYVGIVSYWPIGHLKFIIKHFVFPNLLIHTVRKKTKGNRSDGVRLEDRRQ